MQIQINVGKLTSPMPRCGNAGYVCENCCENQLFLSKNSVKLPKEGSGILGFGMWNSAQGNLNTAYEWNPESNFH